MKAVKDVLGTRPVPLLILSGSAEEETRTAALKAGADEFLVKPIRPQSLRLSVSEALRRAAV